MTKRQFRVLYRQFLFRIVDPELLSGHAQGDVNTLLGQFAALLIVVSLVFCLPLGVANAKEPLVRLIGTLGMENLLISTTMLAVGLLAVLSWDSTFPDRREVLVLAPLPVRASTLFLAKAAASMTALGLTVAVLNSISGMLWPFAIRPYGRLRGVLWSFSAWWVAMFAAGAFIYCSVLCLQGLAAQFLPRRWFLRLSSFLQIAVFCIFLSVYFLQPPFASLSEMVDPADQRLLAWLPSYWFLGALRQLNGSSLAVLEPLARRAWAGLAVTIAGTALVFFLSWFRTLRRIVEEPDITPGVRGIALPRFGNAWQTAIRAIQHSQSVSRPPASPHSGVLSGRRVCAGDPAPEVARSAAADSRGAGRSAPLSRERADAGFNDYPAGFLDCGDSHPVRASSGSAGQLGFPHHTHPGWPGMFGREPAHIARVGVGASVVGRRGPVVLDLAVAARPRPSARPRAFGRDSR